MRKIIQIILVMVFSLTVTAQDVTVVFSQNKCKMNKLSDLQKMMEENGAVILNDLVEQEKLIDWGVLTHAWGDEYNWNVYYVAESHAKFLEAWDEFIKRVGENDPEFGDKLWEICWEHKDSIYTQIMGYGQSQASSDE